MLHDKDLCIGCGYCFYACPFGAPQFPQAAPSACAARWTSARSAPAVPRRTAREAEFKKYGRNRLAEGKLPACAEMCSTKALLGGDGDVIADIYRKRVLDARQGQRSLGLGHRLRPAGGAEGRPRRPPRRERNHDQARRAPGRASRAAIASMLAGCGERPQVIDYKQGKYQGKPDEPPYAAAPFNGDKAEVGARHRRPAPRTRTSTSGSADLPGRRDGKHCVETAAGRSSPRWCSRAALALAQSPSASRSRIAGGLPEGSRSGQAAGGAAAEAAAQQPAGLERGALGGRRPRAARPRNQRPDPAAGPDVARGAGAVSTALGFVLRDSWPRWSSSTSGAVRSRSTAAHRPHDRAVLAGEAFRALGDGDHLRRSGDTGLIITFGKTLLLPLIGYTLFSWLATLAKSLHNFIGPRSPSRSLIFIVMFVRDNLPKAHDGQWMKKFGGMLDRSGVSHVPSGKFNAGEKVLFWSLVVLASLVWSSPATSSTSRTSTRRARRCSSPTSST